MANITFGERMRRARVKSALTQAEVGEKLDVTGANWEKGKTSPDQDQKASCEPCSGWTHLNPAILTSPLEACGRPSRVVKGPPPLAPG